MIIRSALIILAVTVIGRALGFIRGIFISQEFGAGIETDAYFTAFVIPSTLIMILPGTIHSVFIPTLNKVRAEDEEKGKELFKKVFTIISLITLVLTFLGVIFASSIVSALAPGFSPEKHHLTTVLLQWMVPSVFFIGIIGVVSGVLNVKHQFFWPSFGTVISSIVVILSIYFLVPYMGIEGLALGTMLGFVGYAFIMFPSLFKHGYITKFTRNFLKDEHIKSMTLRIGPIFLASFMSQITVYAERFFASGLGDAKISALALSWTLIQGPMALFVSAITVPLFPVLADYVSKGKFEELRKTLEKGLAYLAVILIPVMAGMIIMREDLVRLFFERGQFGPRDTLLTAWALLFFSIAILGRASRDLMTRTYYALENTKSPMIYGIISFVVYLVISPFLMKWLDHGGLALASSISAYVAVILLNIGLRKQMGPFITKSYILTILKSFAGTLVMSVFIYIVSIYEPIRNRLYEQAPLYISLTAVILIGAVLYFGVLALLKEQLMFDILNKAKRKFVKAKV